MKYLVIIFFPLFTFAQNDSIKFYGRSKSNLILVGYQASFDPKDDKNDFERLKTVHIIEVNLSKVIDNGGRHPSSYNYYLGNDFVLKSNEFIIGPKIGFNMSANALSLGSEMVFYTNFKNFSPRFVPFVGMGFYGFKMFVSFPIRFVKTDFIPVNRINLGITLPIYNLNKKKFEITPKN